MTAASRGIGKAIALALAEAGCHVIVNYQIDQAAAQQVTKTIRKIGRGCTVVKADVSLVTGVDHIVGEIENTFGQVDILVNSAGVASSKPYSELSLQDWEHTLRVNLTSAFVLSQRVLINTTNKNGVESSTYPPSRLKTVESSARITPPPRPV